MLWHHVPRRWSVAFPPFLALPFALALALALLPAYAENSHISVYGNLSRSEKKQNTVRLAASAASSVQPFVQLDILLFNTAAITEMPCVIQHQSVLQIPLRIRSPFSPFSPIGPQTMTWVNRPCFQMLLRNSLKCCSTKSVKS